MNLDLRQNNWQTLFGLLVLISLLLFASSAVLWGWSYRRAVTVAGFDRTSRTGVVLTRGKLLVYRQLYLDQQGPAEWVRWERYVGRAVEMEVYLMPGTTPHLGFFFGDRGTRIYPTRQFLTPMWAVVIVYTRSVGSGWRDGYRAMVEASLRVYPDPPPHERTTIQKAVPKRRPPDPSFCGFAFYHHAYVRKDGPPCSEMHRVTVPLWSLTALAATPPALCGIGFCWNRRRGARGRCTTCAYDLTGNESGVCPECGTAAALLTTVHAGS